MNAEYTSASRPVTTSIRRIRAMTARPGNVDVSATCTTACDIGTPPFHPDLAERRSHRTTPRHTGECAAAPCVHPDMSTVGIIGAGHIGSTLATGLVARGYDVVIANSRGPETLADLVGKLGGKARAATASEAADAADWAIVTVPMTALPSLPAAELAGKIVLDTCNYYWERDGHIPELDEKKTTSSQLIARTLPGAKVAKAFNHIMSTDILVDGTPAGTPDRRALATASDDQDAAAFVTALYDEFGYDTVNVGPLAESWRLERDQPAYVVRQNAGELRANLARATR